MDDWQAMTIEAANARIRTARLLLFEARERVAGMDDTEYSAFIADLHRRWIVTIGPALLSLWLATTPGARVLGSVLPDPEQMFQQIATDSAAT